MKDASNLREILIQSFREESVELLKEIHQSFEAFGAADSLAKRSQAAKSLFRAAHSLKGASRAVELPEVEGLSALLEEKFRAAAATERGGFSPGDLELIKESIAALRALIDTDQCAVDLAELMDKLEAVKVRPIEIATPAPVKAGPAPASPSKPSTAKPSKAAPIDPRVIVAQAFAEEQEPLLLEFRNSVGNLQKSQSAEDAAAQVEKATRAMHSLKGAARAVELPEVEALSAAVEERLRTATKKKKLMFSSDGFVLLNRTADVVQALVDSFVHHRPGDASAEDLETLVLQLEDLPSSEFEAIVSPPETAPDSNTTTAEPGAGPVAAPQASGGLGHRLRDYSYRIKQQASDLVDAESCSGKLHLCLEGLDPDCHLVQEMLGKLDASPEVARALERILAGLTDARDLSRSLDGQVRDLVSIGTEDNAQYLDFVPDIYGALNLEESPVEQGLLVWEQGLGYLIASGDVRKIIPWSEVVRSEEGLVVDGKVVTSMTLSSILQQEAPSVGAANQVAVLIGSDQREGVLILDSLGGMQEIRVQPSSWPIERLEHILGFAVVGRRQAVPVLNVDSILGVLLGAQSPGKTSEEAEKAIRVLFVDDSLTSRQLIKAVLEGHGLSVEARVHGQQALETLISEENRDRFDILVSDVEMPHLTGLELVVEVRKQERFKNFPIILVSTLDTPEHVRMGLEAGADAYVAKGDFNSTTLVDTIRDLIVRKGASS